ncbi:MAG: hypothetical protein ACYTG7_04040 [Planctomycetota bacterium]
MKGIQRRLWEQAHAWTGRESDFVFLFTDDSAAGFYESLGFRKVPEFFETIPCPESPRSAGSSFRKLDLEQDGDFALVEVLARTREMVSHRIGFYNPNLLLFMFLYVYPEMTFYIEDLDAVVVAEARHDRIRIHDVVASTMPGLADLEDFLASFEKKEIEFLFCTDRLDAGRIGREPVTDSLLFIHGDFDLDGEFIFPSSIRA